MTCWPCFFLYHKIGFLGCKCTLPAHVSFFIHEDPQVLIHRAALKSIHPPACTDPGDCSNPDARPGAVALVELHEVPLDSLLKSVKLPLDGVPCLNPFSCTSQLGVIPKPTKGLHVAAEHIERLIKILYLKM